MSPPNRRPPSSGNSFMNPLHSFITFGCKVGLEFYYKIKKENWPTRHDLGLPTDKKIVILQGAGINVHRGAEEALEAMRYVNDALLLIAGSGDVIQTLKKMAAGLEDKVMFKPKMPYEELMGYTRNADLGLSFDKDISLNYRYSLPNKLFDYIQAEIPVLCSNLIEVANVVTTWDIGTIIESHDPIHIAKKINEILKNDNQLKVWKQNLSKASKELCWEKEETALMKIYNPLL